MKKLTRPQSVTPPIAIGPGTRADHGADSAAGHPGCMGNRFQPVRKGSDFMELKCLHKITSTSTLSVILSPTIVPFS
jgi:hypothetical protein